MSRVNEALREARIAAGLSQNDIARALGVSQPFVNDIEHGRRELGEKHYEKLPQPIRAAVMKAVVADLQERLAKARQLMRSRDDGGKSG
jgi:transcriptional regulator with XRE-family HTH domain